jgi:hypothetical protein
VKQGSRRAQGALCINGLRYSNPTFTYRACTSALQRFNVCCVAISGVRPGFAALLIFRNTTLADAVAEFNRYNKRKVFIEDPAGAALTIAGNFRCTNLDSFVEIIEKGYPVRVNDRGGDFVLSAER